MLNRLGNARLNVNQPVENVEGEGLVDIEELIVMHRSSSSNYNFAVNLARGIFTNEELINRTFVGGRRGGGGAGADAHGQLDALRLQQIRNNYFRIVNVADMLKSREWKECCKAIDTAGRVLLRKHRARLEFFNFFGNLKMF